MVIPVSGPSLVGPPPPEVETHVRKIKVCLLCMLYSLAAKIVSGTLLIGLIQATMSSMNLILNCIMGIFVLKGDARIAPMHRFLMTTCFQSCAEGCPDGMGCLPSFVLCNLITVVLDVLMGPTLPLMFVEVPNLVQLDKWENPAEWLVHAVFLTSVTTALVSQCLATYYGYQAYSQAMEAAGGTIGGYGPLGGNPSVAPMGVGRQLGGAARPASAQGQGYTPPQLGQAPAASAQPFKPFSGQGQRLGGR